MSDFQIGVLIGGAVAAVGMIVGSIMTVIAYKLGTSK